MCFQEFVLVSKELFQMREKMVERNEEIFELKSERSNTKVSFHSIPFSIHK